MIAHECGHQAFSKWQSVNDGVGLVLHSLLLVPYYSWYARVPLCQSSQRSAADAFHTTAGWLSSVSPAVFFMQETLAQAAPLQHRKRRA